MWPIDGGNLLIKETTTFDLLITGHEDGSVKFWDIRSGKDMQYVSLSVYTVVRTVYHSVYTLW